MRRLLYPLSLCLFSSIAVLAAQSDSYGLEVRSSARVTAVAAESDDAFAALYNPGQIAAQSASLFSFSTISAGASYDSLGEVLLPAPGPTSANGPPQRGTLTVPAYQTTLWALGFTHPFALPFWNGHHAGLGLVVSGPFGLLRQFSASTPNDFYSLRYGTSDRQFKGTASLAVELWPRHLYWGIGATLFITGSGDAEAAMVSNDPKARANIDVGTNTSLVTGLYGQWGSTAAGLVYHDVIDPQYKQRLVGLVQLGPTDIATQPMLFQSSQYYEPRTLEAEVQQAFSWGKISGGIVYQHWQDYHPSYLVVQTLDSDGRPQGSQLPPIPFHSTWSPRASVEVPVVPWLTIGAGYQYRPSPVSDLSGPGNIIDTDEHVMGLGLSHRFGTSAAFPWPVTLGLYGQYHHLVPRDVNKTSSDSIGSPHYRISGSAYAYGLSVQAEL